MVQRLTYRRRLSYNTRSNRVKVVKTPGGRLVYHYRKKPRRVPRCADTGKKLTGIRSARPHEKRRMKKKYKTVNRTYGGVLCHSAVRQRIIRAFLVEEQKIVRKVLKAQQASAAARK